MYTFIDKFFIMLIFFMYLLISPILFIHVPMEGPRENVFQPILLSIFLTYLFSFYYIIGSNCLFIKSLGYGMAVFPLILLSNEIEN